VKNKYVKLIIILVAIAAISAVAVWAATKKKPSGSTSPSDLKNYQKAAKGDLKMTVKATGTIEPRNTVQVKSDATGRIEKLLIKEGDFVKQGNMIAVLDQRNQKIALERAQVNEMLARVQYEMAKEGTSASRKSDLDQTLKQAENAYKQAKDNAGRIKALKEKGYATQQEYDTAERGEKDAKATLENAQKQAKLNVATQTPKSIKEAKLQWDLARVNLKDARKGLGDATIKSPIDGTVLEKKVNVGDTVVSSASVFGEGTTLCSVADMGLIQIRTTIDEVDVGRVKIGQIASVTADAFPERTFAGRVANVFPQGTVTGGVTSFVAIVEVPNEDRALLSGMTTTVEITAQTIKNVVNVPFDCIRVNSKNEPIVYVRGEKGTPEERKVRLGPTDYTNTQIVEGLKEGEMVMIKNVPGSSSVSFASGPPRSENQ